MRTLSLIVEATEHDLTVKTVLRRRLYLADRLLRHLKFVPGAVQRNGEAARLLDRVEAGDLLTVHLDEKSTGKFAPVSAELSVLYEDEDLLLVDKAAGMPMHSGKSSLAGAIAAYLGAETPFHPVQRLDKGTSGVLCIAKSRYLHDRLRRMLHSDDFRREYLAIVCGKPSPKAGFVDAPISKTADAAHRHFVTAEGLPSCTHYETLSSNGELSLLRLRLDTGRTHQIRVHMAHIGCPLLGDTLYGAADRRIGRPALHSRTLSLLHPLTGERLTVSAPVPADMDALIKQSEL